MAHKETAAIDALLQQASRVLAITHIGPDGDAIGSLTALGVALKQRGKQVTMVCDDNVPLRYRFLPLVERVQQYPDANSSYDLVIALDCGDMGRMGNAFESLPEPKPPVINIDHHVTNTLFGVINLVDSECNATAEILYDLLPALGVTVSKDLATCLLTGIVTDTLGFRTAGVTASTLNAAGRLMELGADLNLVTTQALLIKPLSTLRLWQIGLDKMKLEEDGLLWTAIGDAERQAIGYVATGSGGLVNMLANVDEAVMSAVLIEHGTEVHVGFRCRPPFNVAELALNLGGGGHPLASGCTLDGPLENAVSLVLSLSKETIQQQKELLYERG